ncbi:unnamed protein product [Choristocarpus tenellus]
MSSNTQDSDQEPQQILQHELQTIRDMFPARMIKACNEKFVQIIIMRTPHAKISSRLQFKEGYPNTPILVELDSPSLHHPFLRKLTKQAEEEAHKLVGSGQVVAALKVIVDTVNLNKFVPCWKELRKSAQMVAAKGAVFGADEASGIVTIKVKSGLYHLKVSIQVPDGYPMEGCGIELRSHNFPTGIARGHLTQAQEIVRRCLCGYSPEMALQTSNPISLPAHQAHAGRDPKVRITSEHIRNIKHDVSFIKKAHDLREFDGARNKDNHSEAAHSTKQRRAARRELKTLTKAEAANDEEQAKRLEEVELKEQEDLLYSQLSDTSQQPSLLPLVDFVLNVFAMRLPQEKCVSCKSAVMPENPQSLSLSDPEHPDRPTRVFCGHWFHYDCLRKWMTEPPFAKDCPLCSRRVYHPDWPQSVKQLERSWANKQAKTREIGEVRDFLEVDERFQARSGDDFGAFT